MDVRPGEACAQQHRNAGRRRDSACCRGLSTSTNPHSLADLHVIEIPSARFRRQLAGSSKKISLQFHPDSPWPSPSSSPSASYVLTAASFLSPPITRVHGECHLQAPFGHKTDHRRRIGSSPRSSSQAGVSSEELSLRHTNKPKHLRSMHALLLKANQVPSTLLPPRA